MVLTLSGSTSKELKNESGREEYTSIQYKLCTSGLRRTEKHIRATGQRGMAFHERSTKITVDHNSKDGDENAVP